MINTSLLSRPSSRIKSALDKNLNANANSINPKITLTLLNHIPDLGKTFNEFGEIARKVKGNARETPKPSIPNVKSKAPDCDVILPTKSEPKIGPVQENETKQSVNAIKNVEIIPVEIFDALSILFVHELGNVISNKPNNDSANNMKTKKNKKFSIGLVEI